MNGLSILGTGRSLPDHIVTNDDLARRVETSNDWIVSRTGIRETGSPPPRRACSTRSWACRRTVPLLT